MADVRTACRVTSITPTGDRGFLVTTDTGEAILTAGVVAATGSFGSPHPPDLLGRHSFDGRVIQVADYRRPEPYVDQRVVIVGADDSPGTRTSTARTEFDFFSYAAST